jgi:hypothetical protein
MSQPLQPNAPRVVEGKDRCCATRIVKLNHRQDDVAYPEAITVIAIARAARRRLGPGRRMRTRHLTIPVHVSSDPVSRDERGPDRHLPPAAS